jgi:outer membrane protein assembly factor BamB
MKSLSTNREQTASCRIVPLMLAITPLWLMLAAANTYAQASNDVSSSTTTTSTPSDTVLNVGNVGNLQLKWKALVGSVIDEELGAPIVANGIVYSRFFDNVPLALNASTGAQLWSFDKPANFTPHTVANGVFYFVGEDGNLYALNASTGAQLWSFATGGSGLVESPFVVANGVVYIGSPDGNVYALNASTGAKLWTFTTGGSSFSFAVASGVVYFGSADKNVYALNASTGAKLWSSAAGGEVFSSLAVANGVVYFGSTDNNVYALNASTGAKLWSFATGEKSSPQVVNGVVYVGSAAGFVYALNASTGAQLWSFDDGVSPVGPLVVAGGVIYVGCSPGLCAVNAGTGELMWGTDPAFGGVAAVANGVVYTVFRNSVFALNPTTSAQLWSYSVPTTTGPGGMVTDFSAITVEDGTLYVSASTGPSDPQSPGEFSAQFIYAFSVGADLFLRIQPTPTTVHQGDLITYAFPVWNLGPANAVHEVLNTQVPAGTTFDYIRISGTPGLGTCTTPPYQGTGQIVCHENSVMAPNTTWTVRLTVKVTAPKGTVITENAATMANTTDPNMANNTATVTTTVQ